MSIEPPKLVDVTVIENGEQVSAKYWKITVPSHQNLEWCVVLSYLKLPYLNTGIDFVRKLKSLMTDVSKVSVKQVRNSISKYNPFLNEYSVFDDAALKSVVSEFEQKLKIRSYKTAKEPNKICSLINYDIYSLINYGINVFYFDNQDLFIKKRLIPADYVKRKEYLPDLNLVLNTDDTCSFYSFFLDEMHSFDLQMAAIRWILNRTDLKSKNIRKLIKLIKCHNNSEHFIIYLLKSDLRDLIPEIYRYPYITHKLIKAGLKIDPRIQVKEGYSVLSSALLSNHDQLAYTLFIYVANNFYKSKNTYRNPDSNIISNLSDLDEIITSDYEKITEKSNQEKLYELKQFNKFLCDVCGKLQDIETEINDIRKISKNFTDIASKQLENISWILKSYGNYFWMNDHRSSDSLFDSFHKHKFYYDILDISAALIFFDSIFKMKKVLFRNHNKFYFELELKFFLSVLSHKYFPNKTITNVNTGKTKYKNFANSNFLAEIESKSAESNYVDKFPQSFFFGILVRFNLKENIDEFSEQLSTELQYETDIPKGGIPRKSLDCPVIKDEFMMCRLQHYVDTALNINVRNIESVLVIERALQILGEALKFDEQNTETFSYLLRCAIPVKIVASLNDLRNELSHFDRVKAVKKFKIEKDIALFQSIQTELKEIMNAFNIVFDIQKVRLLGFLKKNWKNFLEDWKLKDIKDNEREKILSIIPNVEKYLDEKESFDVDIRNYIPLLKNICKEINPDKTLPHLRKAYFGLEHLVNFLNDNCKERYFEGIPTITNQDVTNMNKNDLLHGATKMIEFVDGVIIQCLTSENSVNFNSEQDIEYIDKFKTALITEAEKLPSNETRATEHQFTSSIQKTKRFIPVKKKNNAIFEKPDSAERDTSISFKVNPNSYDILINILTPFFEIEDTKPKKTLIVNNATNLFNRIQHIEIILLGNSDIKKVLRRSKSKDSYNHLILKIAHRYLRESDFQASIEMLLFDCLAIQLEIHDKKLKEKKKNKQAKQISKYSDIVGLKGLWIKGRKLYSGINMRNVLAHGDFLLEALSDLLDPDDFPSELAIKLVQLLTDMEAVEAVGLLWQNVNGNNDHFNRIMTSNSVDVNEKQNELRFKIQSCNRWKTYYSLLLKDS